MKIKLNEVVGDMTNKNLKGLLLKDVDSSAVFDVLSNIRLIELQMENFNKTRMSLFKKYGEKIIKKEGDKEIDTGEMKIKPENEIQFRKEMEELGKKEIDIDIKFISKTALKGSIKPLELIGLDWMFKD